MALVIGLVAAAARAMSSSSHDHDQQNYNNGRAPNGQYYNNSRYGNACSNGYGYNNGYNSSYGSSPAPYAAYAPQMTGSRRAERRMHRRMRKAERKARDADMVMAFMGSGPRGAPRSAELVSHPQQVPPYTRYGESSSSSSRARSAAAYPPETQGVSTRAPEYRDRPASQDEGHAARLSTESLPTYEQVVRRSGKS